jgi:hypothetical protein
MRKFRMITECLSSVMAGLRVFWTNSLQYGF